MAMVTAAGLSLSKLRALIWLQPGFSEEEKVKVMVCDEVGQE